MSLVVEPSGGTVVAASKSMTMKISKTEKGSEVHFSNASGDPGEGELVNSTQNNAFNKWVDSGMDQSLRGDMIGKLSDSFVKAGKTLGVSRVSVDLYSESSIKTFTDKGFKVVSKPEDKYSPYVVSKEIPKSKSRRSYEELMKFYESRGFCATGPGGGIDNSCGGSSSGSTQAGAAKEALAKYEAGRKTATGSLLESAAKGAIIGGIVGSPGGVTGYFAGSITGALLNVVGHGVAAAVGAVASKNLDSLAKSIGVTQGKLSSASSALFGSESKPFALDSKTIAIESGDNIALISSGSQFSKASGTAFHFQPGSDVNGTLDIKAVEKAARATGAKVVSAEVWSDSDAKSLTSKGYRQVVASPGGFSKSKGVYEKKLSGSKRSSDPRADQVVADTLKFLKDRRA